MKIYVENIIDCLNEKVYINILKGRTLSYWSVTEKRQAGEMAPWVKD